MGAKPKLKLIKDSRLSPWDEYLYIEYIKAETLNDDVTRFNILDKTVELRKEGYKLTKEIP